MKHEVIKLIINQEILPTYPVMSTFSSIIEMKFAFVEFGQDS